MTAKKAAALSPELCARRVSKIENGRTFYSLYMLTQDVILTHVSGEGMEMRFKQETTSDADDWLPTSDQPERGTRTRRRHRS
jgi:hypothetical protein